MQAGKILLESAESYQINPELGKLLRTALEKNDIGDVKRLIHDYQVPYLTRLPQITKLVAELIKHKIWRPQGDPELR